MLKFENKGNREKKTKKTKHSVHTLSRIKGFQINNNGAKLGKKYIANNNQLRPVFMSQV